MIKTLLTLTLVLTIKCEDIKHVHLLFMNHLDVGYDGLLPEELGFVNNVINKYFVEYFPRSINTSATLRELGYYEKQIYTTHPWLVRLYLHCPPNLVLSGIKLQCPNETEKAKFIAAARRGDITWHAGPMNMYMETMDPMMVGFGVQLSIDLDKELGIKRKYRTLSQRDVPAMTQAVLPILTDLGIEAVSVGVNTVTAPPAVPPIFNWKFKNSSVIGIWHPGGYPDNPGPNPAKPYGLSRRDCATFPGFDHALCFAFRTDNSGPPMDYEEVLGYYEIARSQFPGADVQSSSLEAFVEALMPYKSKLPVITKEFGDTWIQGSASDPRKVAEMRAVFRARTKCLQSESGCSLSDPRFYNASVFFLKHGEHTWGLSSVFDSHHWSNDAFYPIMSNLSYGFVNGTLSWQEQRNFTNLGLEALGNHTLATEIVHQLGLIQAKKPNMSGFDNVGSPSEIQKCSNGFEFQFDSKGSLIHLKDPASQNVWADNTHPLGAFVYQTLNQTDFDFFNRNYPYSPRFQLGIGKPNISKANATSGYWDVSMQDLFKSKEGCSFILHLQMSDPTSMSNYGAPAVIYVKYTGNVVSKQMSSIDVELQWFQKPPTRMPESIYFMFRPISNPKLSWKLHKVGQFIDPLNVILNGSQILHAIDKGVYYTDSRNQGLSIESPDVAVVNVLTPGSRPSVIPVPLKPIKAVDGMAFNLFNNVWDVNFIFWYPFEKRDVNQKFRFKLNITPA